MKELRALAFDARDHINTSECEQGMQHYLAGNSKPDIKDTVSDLRFSLGYELAKKVMTISNR